MGSGHVSTVHSPVFECMSSDKCQLFEYFKIWFLPSGRSFSISKSFLLSRLSMYCFPTFGVCMEFEVMVCSQNGHLRLGHIVR